MDTSSQYSVGRESQAAIKKQHATALPVTLMPSEGHELRVQRTSAPLENAPEPRNTSSAVCEQVSEFRGYIVDVTEHLGREAWHFSLWLTKNDDAQFPIEESGYGHKGKFLTTQAMWNHLRMFCSQDNTLFTTIEQELQSKRRAYLPPLYIAHLQAYDLGWKQP